MSVLVGFGHHGITCGSCGESYNAIESAPSVQEEGKARPTPAVKVKCWSGCSALFPRNHPSIVAALGAAEAPGA